MNYPFEVRMRTSQGAVRPEGIFQIWSKALVFARSLVRECGKPVEIVDHFAASTEAGEQDESVVWRGAPKPDGGCEERFVRPRRAADAEERETARTFEVRSGPSKLAVPSLRTAHRCACFLARQGRTLIVDLEMENLPEDDGIIWDSALDVCARQQMWWAAQSGRGRTRRVSEPVAARAIFRELLRALRP